MYNIKILSNLIDVIHFCVILFPIDMLGMLHSVDSLSHLLSLIKWNKIGSVLTVEEDCVSFTSEFRFEILQTMYFLFF